LLYPIDEPHGKNIQKMSEIYDFIRKIGINNKFFLTVENENAAYLANKIEIVQVHSAIPNLVDKVQKQRNKKTKLWIYEATQFSKGRNISPVIFMLMGIKAYYYNAEGIGVWNYADVSSLYTDKGIDEFNKGKGSWNLEIKNSAYDYSLIYRQKDNLYSSIRWEALTSGMEVSTWLGLYKQKYGILECNAIVDSLLQNRISLKLWENIKLKLIN